MIQEFSFQLGQDVEAKSFLKGYRGAWFRCKVEEIAVFSGRKRYCLNYVDFPDEEMHWTMEFQVNPQTRRSSKKILERMLRPLPPVVVREHALESGDYKQSADIVVSNDRWVVGDLVDWWCNDCWWMATITKIFDDRTVQVSLPHPPIGEGGVYTAAMNVLRPSFFWSEKHTWCTPTSQVISSKSLQLSTAETELANTERQAEFSPIEQSEVRTEEFPSSTSEKEPETLTGFQIADKKKVEPKTLPNWKELRLFVKGYVSIFCEETSLKDHENDASAERRSQGESEGSHELKSLSGKKRKAEKLDV